MIEKSLTQPTQVDEDQREITVNLIPPLRKTVLRGSDITLSGRKANIRYTQKSILLLDRLNILFPLQPSVSN